MSEYMVFEDYVTRYEDYDIYPTEREGFPIHHTDPFWNAALFDEPQADWLSPSYYDYGQEVTLTDKNELVIRHDVPSCHEGVGEDDVTATFQVDSNHLYVFVRSEKVGRAIWIGPSAARKLRDYLNSNPF